MYIIGLFIIPSFSNADFIKGQCSKNGYTIAIINGMNTVEEKAKDNMKELRKTLGLSHYNQNINFQYLYNVTHLGGLQDYANVAHEKIFEDQNINDFDMREILNDASQKVMTQKLLLIGHSEGNFYANSFYNLVVNKPSGVPVQSIDVYGVASPASYVAGRTKKYITSSTDKVINLTRLGGVLNVLPANVNIKLSEGSDGHGFWEVYLEYKSERITKDIEISLNNLSENNIQDPQQSCISPPELDVLHKVVKVFYYLTDKPSNYIKVGLVSTYNVGAYIADGARNIGLAIGNVFNKLFATVIENQLDVNNNTKIIIPFVPPAIINKVTTNKITTTVKQIPVKTTPIVIKNVPQPVAPIVPDIPVVQNIVISDAPVIYQTVFSGGAGGANDNLPEPDTTSPVITLTGINPQIINVGSSYTELGAIALDETDGILTVEATGNVDTTTVGTYIVTYTASDLSSNIATLTRTVNVIVPLSSEKKYLTFDFTDPEISVGFIDEDFFTIGLGVSDGTDITALVPTLTISIGATSIPASGVSQNFTNPVIYTVTAEDGSTQAYTVSVGIIPPLE